MPADSPLSLTPTPRRKLTESVAEQLLEEIHRRGLEHGTRMPSERELMKALGVGRSTVREALNGLAMLGVIEIRHGQGAFIVSPPAAESHDLTTALARGVTRDLLEARRPVEIEVARLASQRRTDADLLEIEAILTDHEREIAAGKPGERFAAGFHLALAEAAHNEVLRGFVAGYSKLLEERGPNLEALPGYCDWELADHRRLFDAVAAGDADGAAAAMTGHLNRMTEFYGELGLKV
jgi:DNA-binding FadR family transcriptional regulator